MKKLLLGLLALTIMFAVLACSSPGDTIQDVNEKDDLLQEISTEERKKMDLYFRVMKAAFQEENGGNQFIAVKLDTLEGLGNQSKEELLKALSELSSKVYDFKDISDDRTKFELDNEGRLVRTIDGTLLWVEVEEYSENKAIITGVSWFGNLGAVFPKYEARYKNGMWQLKLISMAIS
jgi:hypothetical protein